MADTIHTYDCRRRYGCIGTDLQSVAALQYEYCSNFSHSVIVVCLHQKGVRVVIYWLRVVSRTGTSDAETTYTKYERCVRTVQLYFLFT